MQDQELARQLLSAAKEASRNAYAPYSQFPVGAALLTMDGVVLTGGNVENVSYGLTICAERSAVVRAIAQGYRKFQAIAVWAEKRNFGAVMPCGACRQVLAEFMSANGLVLIADAQHPNGLRQITMAELLPEAFGHEADPDDNCLHTGSNRLPD